ncbi:hypothetical protein FQN53_003228 [Emmonsiellopsis sp. PD_33]|nr:hypothetical protein FQN53_003228 [Emmonsiellopsis sp. PD_33]
MPTPDHRKIELQSPADLAYLYTNTIALSRQKLDLHFPPSANHHNDPDPMKERVRELVDEFITKTFTTATPSIAINGLDAHSTPNPAFLPSTEETIEYEPYDAALAARVTALYAQLESLNTTVAQLRRDAPARAAREYAEALGGVLRGDDELDRGDGDVVMEGGDGDGDGSGSGNGRRRGTRAGRRAKNKADFVLRIPFGAGQGDQEREKERWTGGEVGEVYGEALRTLVRLQGEAGGVDVDGGDGDGDGARGLATTVGKVERARRAAEVVEGL